MAAEPYIPSSDAEVLQTLPQSLLVNRDELAKLRQRLSSDPKNPALAATIAGRYLSMGKRAGDPRFFGYARSAIGAWWESASADPAILRVRAKLKEQDHQYTEALLDLEKTLEQKPNDAQAILESANILRVLGRYDEALSYAKRMEQVSDEVPAALCRAPVMALTGEAEKAYELLNSILPEAKKKYPSTVGFIGTVKAEIAQALGRDTEVEQHFKTGLDADGQDFQMLRGYADFLLDHDRAEEVLELLTPHVDDNGVLLRAAIAAKKLGNEPLRKQWQLQLEERFREIRLRGSEPHGRFESRYALELNGDPQYAVTMAAAHWGKQKEIRDARNLLEAAIAADDVKAAEPVLAFLKLHGTEHVVLKALVDQLEGKP